MTSNFIAIVLPIIITAVVVAIFVAGTLLARRKGYSGLGGNTIVRCNLGHLYTTIWVPGGSFKSLRLGFFRFQFCPVGRHWAITRPVKEADLTDDEIAFAHQHHDSNIP